MKRAFLTIGFALAAGYTGTAEAQLQVAGSDTLELIMQDLVAQCPDENGGAYDTEGDGSYEMTYIGGGSGNAAAAMERDSGERNSAGARHQIGPMSRGLRSGAECTQSAITRTDPALSGGGVDLGWPAVRPAQIIIGRDDIINLADPSLAALADSGSGGGTPDDWGADLRLLYFGLVDSSYNVPFGQPAAAAPADCAASARSTLATSLGLYHIYRRDDASGTTQDWKRLLSVASAQSFCNTPGVAPATTDESQNDKSDRDPVRIACTNGEDVCSCDGTLGLLLPILVPPVTVGLDVLYPTQACGTAQDLVFTQLDHNGNAVTKNLRNGRFNDTGDRCPGGAARLGTSGCLFWKTAGGQANCIHPNVDQTVGLALNSTLITASAGTCPTDNSNDIRAANLSVRTSTGAIVDAGGTPHNVNIVDWEGRGYYRIHMTTGSTAAMGSVDCQEPSATTQIGCLVARDDAAGKISMGFSGLESLDVAGSNDYSLALDGIDSAKVANACTGNPCTSAAQCTCAEGMVCDAGACAPGVFPMTRKIYMNVLSYYDPTDTFRLNPAVAEPAAPNGASGTQNNIYAGADEADFLECVLSEVNDLVDTVVVDNHNFLPRLASDPIIEPVCPATAP